MTRLEGADRRGPTRPQVPDRDCHRLKSILFDRNLVAMKGDEKTLAFSMKNFDMRKAYQHF